MGTGLSNILIKIKLSPDLARNTALEAYFDGAN